MLVVNVPPFEGGEVMLERVLGEVVLAYGLGSMATVRVDVGAVFSLLTGWQESARCVCRSDIGLGAHLRSLATITMRVSLRRFWNCDGTPNFPS